MVSDGDIYYRFGTDAILSILIADIRNVNMESI